MKKKPIDLNAMRTFATIGLGMHYDELVALFNSRKKDPDLQGHSDRLLTSAVAYALGQLVRETENLLDQHGTDPLEWPDFNALFPMTEEEKER